MTPESHAHHGSDILVLEDSDVDAHILETVLRRSGFTVHRVTRLADALAALRSSRFDVILTDLGLPDSTGLDTTHALVAECDGVPVVVISGRDDETTALGAIAIGAQDYLVKGSADPDAIVRAVRSAVERRRATAEIRRNEDRLTEQALNQLRQRYDLILNSICDGVLGVDRAGNVLFENPAAAKMLGRRPSEMVGRPAHATIHRPPGENPPGAESACPLYDALADGQVHTSSDDTFWDKDGTPVRVAYIAAPMFDDQQRIAGAVVTFRDITRLRQMEQKIEQALRIASLGRVSASVAHEFNNLLMGLRPFAEILRRRAASDQSLVAAVEHILSVVRRGQRLTDEILRFTRPPELVIAPIDVAAWLAELAEEGSGIAGDRAIEVFLPEALHIHADADRLSQVMLNLVANARDATRAGETIMIGAARGDQLPFVRKQVPGSAGHAALFVRDYGSGISRETLDRIFEPLFTTKTTGTGLGLSIAFRIMEQHHGHILIDTEIGIGTTFYLVLPIDTK